MFKKFFNLFATGAPSKYFSLAKIADGRTFFIFAFAGNDKIDFKFQIIETFYVFLPGEIGRSGDYRLAKRFDNFFKFRIIGNPDSLAAFAASSQVE